MIENRLQIKIRVGMQPPVCINKAEPGRPGAEFLPAQHKQDGAMLAHGVRARGDLVRKEEGFSSTGYKFC
jgi:hypothetical protein